MNSEIEFGNVEHSQPEPGLRPDQDKHFVVVGCGEVSSGDLPVYVDMDVLRDMEAHARENTRVELGGVMLGRHHLDGEGKPFVLISDSLRARHYEATRGSFKFTHDTWNQITRERNEFRKDLEMVGWYHTHPGWGVFLSGMDLFICNNFFNRPLDVALVIDPCAGDRGWFQWSEDEQGKTRQTTGFYLISNRHRQSELNYYADMFGGQNSRVSDSRFKQSAFSDNLTSSSPLEDTMVNLVDNRRPVFEFAIVSMLLLQLLVVCLIGWRMTESSLVAQSDEVESRIATIEDRLINDRALESATIREKAFGEILGAIVESKTGEQGLVEKYANIAASNQLLHENLEGQLSRAKLANQEKERLYVQLQSEKFHSRNLSEELDSTSLALIDSKKTLADLKSELGIEEAEVAAPNISPWILYSLGGLGLFVLGGLGGFFATRIFQWEGDESDRDDSRDSKRDRSLESTTAGKHPFKVSDSESVVSPNIE